MISCQILGASGACSSISASWCSSAMTRSRIAPSDSSTCRRNCSSSSTAAGSADSVMADSFPEASPSSADGGRNFSQKHRVDTGRNWQRSRRFGLAILAVRGYQHPPLRGRCATARGRVAAHRGSCSRRGDAVYIACSSLCFASYSLDKVLRTVNELQFAKVDLALHRDGPHLSLSDVATDVNRVAQLLRIHNMASAACHLDLVQVDPESARESLRAVCRLGRLLTVPILTLPAAPVGSDLDEEVRRLTYLTRLAEAEGMI